jgi:hypothetical protein
VSCQPHLLRIDDDDVIAAVDVRGEAGLVLAAQPHRDDAGKPAKNDPFGIDQKPIMLNFRRFCGVRRH